MSHYFASDVHLRHDQPARDRRFHAWLTRLTRDDSLFIVGDLCDFWMGARRFADDPLRSASLKALAEFRRQGGSLKIMAGNHDEWMCPFYEAELGARIISEPHEMTVHGLRLRVVHGHLLGARQAWKSLLESRVFFQGFSYVPGPLARTFDRILAWRNRRGLGADEDRHLRVYQKYAAQHQGTADIVVFGHVHRPVDLAQATPRLIVLGGWQHHRSSFLKIDESGATLHVEHDRDRHSGAETRLGQPYSTHLGELDEV